MKPIVAVVGRPNVGKSTLVNRLAQTSDAIVHESRGVTRDRSYHTADWNGREFTIVDTGGIEPLKSDDVFATSIRDQALAAAEEAAVILFVVDGRTGVTEEDESVARMLKRCDKPVFLLVNKLDNPDRENDSIWEFYSLGIGEPTPLSALHGHGTGFGHSQSLGQMGRAVGCNLAFVHIAGRYRKFRRNQRQQFFSSGRAGGQNQFHSAHLSAAKCGCTGK